MTRTKYIARPSAIGAALAAAAMKVDHQSILPTNWVARRVVDNAENSRIGVITEPAVNAHLSFKTAKSLGFVD